MSGHREKNSAWRKFFILGLGVSLLLGSFLLANKRNQQQAAHPVSVVQIEFPVQISENVGDFVFSRIPGISGRVELMVMGSNNAYRTIIKLSHAEKDLSGVRILLEPGERVFIAQGGWMNRYFDINKIQRQIEWERGIDAPVEDSDFDDDDDEYAVYPVPVIDLGQSVYFMDFATDGATTRKNTKRMIRLAIESDRSTALVLDVLEKINRDGAKGWTMAEVESEGWTRSIEPIIFDGKSVPAGSYQIIHRSIEQGSVDTTKRFSVTAFDSTSGRVYAASEYHAEPLH